jgi:hypothetical protein
MSGLQGLEEVWYFNFIHLKVLQNKKLVCESPASFHCQLKELKVKIVRNIKYE